jgi:guanylate kinase
VSNKAHRPGKLFILFGASGAGKTTLIKQVCNRFGTPILRQIITCTTRKPRAGELDGLDYFFLLPEEFAGLSNAGMFFEATCFLGNFYATPISEINFLELGHNLIIAAELEGIQKLATIPGAVLIFVDANINNLIERGLSRGNLVDKTSVLHRLQVDQAQIATALKNLRFQHKLINDDLVTALDKLEVIIQQELNLRW